MDKCGSLSLETRISEPKFPAGGQRKKWGQTEGWRGGLEKTEWEIRVCLDLNPKSVSHPANQATRFLLLRIKRTFELPFIFYIQFGIESAWLGVASGLCFAAWGQIWLMLFECLLQHESREKRSRMFRAAFTVFCVSAALKIESTLLEKHFFIFSFRSGCNNRSEKCCISLCLLLRLLLTKMHYVSCEENLQ